MSERGWSKTARVGGRLGIAVALLGLALTGAEAMPLDGAALRNARSDVIQIQHRPGYYKGLQYRRAMRRYRGHPGARYELRQNRQEFCRGAPQYC